MNREDAKGAKEETGKRGKGGEGRSTFRFVVGRSSGDRAIVRRFAFIVLDEGVARNRVF
ncbi:MULTISPECIES: hypothetical protein [unclassified Microcoleus]|uniref:hypothetical protein n=1 Tax=unclassified Microcoleus TaxID=2642155 RepID=UPI0025CF7F97|nr:MULTISPECIES: hypothetical protein [unclassified Microcoleus]